MVLVDGDVAYAVDSYITWISCMLREIELMTLSGVHLYRIYRYIIHVVIVISTATEVAFWSFQFENLNLAKKKG